MSQYNLDIFANFLIDNDETFERMKDSFFSFNKADINSWVINVRGKLRKKTISFFKKNIDKNLFIFSFDSNNWFCDTRKILNFLSAKYIFFWVEDHICLRSEKDFNDIIREIVKYKIDYLEYSFFFKGLNQLSLENIKYIKKKNILYLNYNKEIHKKRLEWFYDKKIRNIPYIISQCSIMKIELFKKIINHNSLSFFKKNVPFRFEKNFRYLNWLPYKLGIIKDEFFASIDDDNHFENSCLISRGIYPDRLSILRKKEIFENRISSSSRYNLLGQIYYSKYLINVKKIIKFFIYLIIYRK
jgi:hypothetical protein